MNLDKTVEELLAFRQVSLGRKGEKGKFAESI